MNSLHAVTRRVVIALVLCFGIAAAGSAFAQTAGGGGGHASPAGPSGPSGSGQGMGATAASCSGGPTLLPSSRLGDPTDDVKNLSEATQTYIRTCGCATADCIADALDKYAQALAQVASRLPPRLQNAPDIIATAARRVRVARTKKEALSALSDAIAAIHKDIELVQAEDPSNDPHRTRSADFMVETLNVASLSLEKAGGL
ncbi:MAG: hypothetical protein E7774_05345 [Bradyrhizobium sp.]|nr:MAG: hypothetical protein E7774_05345 [Bradyrhizobium sp.]